MASDQLALVPVSSAARRAASGMKCNACWKVLEGRAVATCCGHVYCQEDAAKILSADSTCPLCDQILSKGNMKMVELSPSDERLNMSLIGIPPQSIMKSAFKGVIFWIGQKDVESQMIISKAQHLRQKYDEMQSRYTQKLEEVHGAYQKAMRTVQALKQEREQLLNDKNELQEKYAEKSRQKRKLEEMYEALRAEYEQLRAAVSTQPRHTSTAQHPNLMAAPVREPGTARLQRTSHFVTNFDTSPLNVPAARQAPMFSDPDIGRAPMGTGGPDSLRSSHPFATPAGNPSFALRNLLLSPMRRPASRMPRSS
eukprot:jgi/Chlat1/2610/Chrsp178S00154